MNRQIVIKFALVAIAEARVAARSKTGDASNAEPTPMQQQRIIAAYGIANPENETAQIARSISLPGVMLYRADGEVSNADVLSEIRRFA